MAPVLVAPADGHDGADRRVARPRRSASPVSRSASSPGTSTTARSSRRGGGADRRVGRCRGGDGEATGVGVAPPPRVAGDGQRAQVAGRPARHEAAAGAVGQPGERAQPVERDVLGRHRAAGLLPALARERPGADEGVEQRRRRRRRGRDVGEEAPVVEGDVVRQQHVVDERQRLVEPEPAGRDGAQGRRRRTPPASARAVRRARSGARIRRVSSSASRAWSGDQPWSSMAPGWQGRPVRSGAECPLRPAPASPPTCDGDRSSRRRTG